MIVLKTVVPKQGDINTYLNAPVLDRVNFNAFDSKAIGVITGVIEKEDGYELTMMLRNKMQYEWINDKVSAISLGISK